MEEERKNQDRETMIPRERFDQVNTRMQEAERKVRDLERDLKALRTEKDKEEEERESRKGEFEKIAERERKKKESAEAERDMARKALLNFKKQTTWQQASAGILTPEAISDAFTMISPEKLENVEPEDRDGFENLAREMAEAKPYLAARNGGAGSRGSDRPIGEGSKESINWREIKRKNRRPAFS